MWFWFFYLLLSFHLVVTEVIKHLLCTVLYIFVDSRRYWRSILVSLRKLFVLLVMGEHWGCRFDFSFIFARKSVSVPLRMRLSPFGIDCGLLFLSKFVASLNLIIYSIYSHYYLSNRKRFPCLHSLI